MIPGTELAELLDDGLLVVSHEGQVRAANPAAEHVLGTERTALIGRGLASLFVGAPEGLLLEACAGSRELSLRATTRRGFAVAVRIVPRASDAWVFVRGQVEPSPRRSRTSTWCARSSTTCRWCCSPSTPTRSSPSARATASASWAAPRHQRRPLLLRRLPRRAVDPRQHPQGAGRSARH
ncbi:PAS domain-containing protein [Nannocystis pusilla]|uniref:PAS domain-containing protein n=1 Tax=Nannocystis pusilla TaxID=889268 RepID=UPI003B7A733A